MNAHYSGSGLVQPKSHVVKVWAHIAHGDTHRVEWLMTHVTPHTWSWQYERMPDGSWNIAWVEFTFMHKHEALEFALMFGT